MADDALTSLIDELKRLPGIGPRSAERIAFHLLRARMEDALGLAEAVRRLKHDVRECERCHHIAEGELCAICADDHRDATKICVVEQPSDVAVIEKSGAYRGLYHVLGGTFAPHEGRGGEDLTLRGLTDRVREGVEEVIVATDADFEGDGTALLVRDALATVDVRITRIARGMPTGGHVEHMSRSVLADAMRGRRRLDAEDSTS